MRHATGAAGADTPTADTVAQAAAAGTSTPGQSLPHRETLEAGFGLDLSHITAHTSSEANATSARIGADAYAAGNHVVVPANASLGLVAHEVTHTLQPKSGVQMSGGLDGGKSDPLEQEADEVAGIIASGGSVSGRFSADSAASGSGGMVQRFLTAGGSQPPEGIDPEAALEMRRSRAHAGQQTVTERWRSALPEFFASIDREPTTPVPPFRQHAYNLLAEDRGDLAPVVAFVEAPGYERHSTALTEALQQVSVDQPNLTKLKQDIEHLVSGAQIQRHRTAFIGHYSLLSPMGKRALAANRNLALAWLEQYAAGPASDHGALEQQQLSGGDFGSIGARAYGHGSHRGDAVAALIAMIRTGAPPLATEEAATTEAGAGTDGEANSQPSEAVQAKMRPLIEAIEQAIAQATSNDDHRLTGEQRTALDNAIAEVGEGEVADEARDRVWAQTDLMARLATALDPESARGLVNQLDPVERLYQDCMGVRDASLPQQTGNHQYYGPHRPSEDQLESSNFRAASSAYETLRSWLAARPSDDQAPLRQRVLEHTKLKDDIIDRLPTDESRVIYRLIMHGTEVRTSEDALHEALETRDEAGVVAALRDLAGSNPQRLQDLQSDVVFQTSIAQMNRPVVLDDNTVIVPYDLCLVLWGMQPGAVQDPGTTDLSEVNPTGNNTPLNMQERLQLETGLFRPALDTLSGHISGATAEQGDLDEQLAFNLRGHADPQVVMDTLVRYDRMAAQEPYVGLLRRSHIVFGRELERRYREEYRSDLRTWIYEHSGPNNRSGANRVLGHEQGAAVGMFNGQVLMAGEVEVEGRMSMQQALREHVFDGKPIYEHTSVESRNMARAIDDDNKDSVLSAWRVLSTAVGAVKAEIERATGIQPIRAIDLLRNNYLEHSGHLETDLAAAFRGDDLRQIKSELGLTDDVDNPPGSQAAPVEDQASRRFEDHAGRLFAALNGLGAASTEAQLQAAAELMTEAIALPAISTPGQSTEAPGPGQPGYSVEERPPTTFAAYYRMHYGASPEDHAVAVLRANRNRGKPQVKLERAAELLHIPSDRVFGELSGPDEDLSIGPHNRHLIRGEFTEETARTRAAQIWQHMFEDGRFQHVQTILGQANEEEQRLIRAAFRQLSGGLDITFFVRQAMYERDQEHDRIVERVGNREGGGFDADNMALATGNFDYTVDIGTEGTARAQELTDGQTSFTSQTKDAELEQMLSVASTGRMDAATRLRAAIRRDSDSEVVQVIDDLTEDERRAVLRNGELLAALHRQLSQFQYERAFKALTGQADLADRLYSRSHGDGWWEVSVTGGTDETGMRRDIETYLHQIRTRHSAEARAEVSELLARDPEATAPLEQAIQREIDRRVAADCNRLGSDGSVRAIMDSELTAGERAEMQATILGGGSAREWAIAAGRGKTEILNEIRALPPAERQRRLHDPTYMRLLGQRLQNESDYRDAVNALRAGRTSGGGLSALEEASRSSREATGAQSNAEATMAALTALGPEEFVQLRNNPRLQVQVMAALGSDSQRAMARAFIAGPEGVDMAALQGAGQSEQDAASTTAPAADNDHGPAPADTDADGHAEQAREAEDQQAALEGPDPRLAYQVHQATYRIRMPCRAHAPWSDVLEQAVKVFAAELPRPERSRNEQGEVSYAEQTRDDPRRMIWDAVQPDVAAFGRHHDGHRVGSDGEDDSVTTQEITGTEMTGIIRAAVLGHTDPSEHWVASQIHTGSEQEAQYYRENPHMRNAQGRQGGFQVSFGTDVSEEGIKEALRGASDTQVIERWSTYMAAPPGGDASHTMKARYDAYRAAYDEALPALVAREANPTRPVAPSSAPATAEQAPAAQAGGGDMDAAIDRAADSGRGQAQAPEPQAPAWTQQHNSMVDSDQRIADAELKRRQFFEFQVNVSAIFEAMLRQHMGDDRQLTPEGTYDPHQARLRATRNKRYNDMIEVLLERIPQLRPDAIAASLGMAEHDQWMLRTEARRQIGLMGITEQRNLRWSGAQSTRMTSDTERQQLDVASFLYYGTFANAMTDATITGAEREQIDHRRSENDRARDAYETAVRTAAMWASLITGVLVTVAATILTGGLATGPAAMLAIGGATALLSGTAQAAMNRAILEDEFDSRDAQELIVREVITGLVTMGTTFYAQRILAGVGSAGRLANQAGQVKQVLGQPPHLWQVFLREGSEEVTSELMDTVVDAGLEATNPEHWIDGYKAGAKRAQSAAGQILAQADDRALAAGITSLVTAGVSRGMRGGRAGNRLDPPTGPTDRRVNLRRNIRAVFGDPEEKFTAAAVEWAMQQAQTDGPIDWSQAPSDLLQGLLQEYKEVGTEVHTQSAGQYTRAERVDRHMAVWGHTLSESERTAYREMSGNADATTPFVSIQDFARIRTEIAIAGMQNWESQNGQPLTTAQRNAFVNYVREAQSTEELHRRSRENPLSVSRVRDADVGGGNMHRQVGQAVDEQTALQAMRRLANGDVEALRLLGITPPPDFDPTKNEWGLGRRTDPVTGEVSYILIRGADDHVDWSSMPDVHPLGHSHPDEGGNHLQNLDDSGTISVAEIIGREHVDRVHFLPSGADLVFVMHHGIPEHTVFTPFQHRGGDRVGNPQPGSNNAGVNIVITQPERAGSMFGNPDMPMVKAHIQVMAGDTVLWEGDIWGAHHTTLGSAIFDAEPAPPMMVKDGAADGTGGSTLTEVGTRESRAALAEQDRAATGEQTLDPRAQPTDVEASRRSLAEGQAQLPLYGLRSRLDLLTPRERRFLARDAQVNQTGRHVSDPAIIANHPNVLIDTGPLTEAEARTLIRQLADGNSQGLRDREIDMAEDFDSKQMEWGLAQMEDGSYRIIRGESGAVNRSGIQGVVDLPGHSHPLSPDRQIRRPRHIADVLKSSKAYLLHPSGTRADIGVARWQPGHTIYLPYQHLGDGMIGQEDTNRPRQGIGDAESEGRAPGIEVRLTEPPRIIGSYGRRRGEPAPVYKVHIQYTAGGEVIFEDDFVVYYDWMGQEQLKPAALVPALLPRSERDHDSYALRRGLGERAGPIDAIELWQGDPHTPVGYQIQERATAEAILRRAGAGDLAAFADIGMVNADLARSPTHVHWGLAQTEDGVFVLVMGDVNGVFAPAGMQMVATAAPVRQSLMPAEGMPVGELDNPASLFRRDLLPDAHRMDQARAYGGDSFLFQTGFLFQRGTDGQEARILPPRRSDPANNVQASGTGSEATVQTIVSKPEFVGHTPSGVPYYKANVTVRNSDGQVIWRGPVWAAHGLGIDTSEPTTIVGSSRAETTAPPDASAAPVADPRPEHSTEARGRRDRGRRRAERSEGISVGDGMQILQTGGNVIRQSTADRLNASFRMNLHKREWGRALEALKSEHGLGNDHHGKLREDGAYIGEDGAIIDNIISYA